MSIVFLILFIAASMCAAYLLGRHSADMRVLRYVRHCVDAQRAELDRFAHDRDRFYTLSGRIQAYQSISREVSG